MYRLKPPLTFGTWGLTVGLAMVGLALPALFANSVDGLRLEMVKAGDIELGYPCNYRDEQLSRMYDCGGTLLTITEQFHYDNPERSMQRIARAIDTPQEGKPEPLKDNDRVWLMPIEGGVLAGVMDEEMMDFVAIQGPDYAMHLSALLERAHNA